ncbi:AzlD family protein [Pseudochrobactrum sp. MP213Fo]|uniref:AzlD family protein n=1 Tax=Pseudochrobactrum sp. MP213Fo TaxID=3022250 RepID=UPI003BA36E10
MSSTIWIIFGAAVLTYLTRIGGHLILSQFARVHYRVEAGLNAVPAAVLTTLVAPSAFNAGWKEFVTLAVCTLVAFRIGLIPLCIFGGLLIVVLRAYVPY